MKLLILILLSASAFAQTKTFSLSLSPVSLPGNKTTVMGAEMGATFTPTPNFDFKNENIVAGGFQYFGGGFNYRLPIISTKLDQVSSNLNGAAFQFGITSTVGIDQISFGTLTVQHYAFTGGGFVNYKIGSGPWLFGGQVEYMKMPGYANNTWGVSFGPKIAW